jgi:hypothetical protein
MVEGKWRANAGEGSHPIVNAVSVIRIMLENEGPASVIVTHGLEGKIGKLTVRAGEAVIIEGMRIDVGVADNGENARGAFDYLGAAEG